MKLLLTLIALASAKPEMKSSRLLKSIDNNNPFKDKPTTGQMEYSVIFEPIRNIKLSISSYQVTTFVDLEPYFDYFRNYDSYINDFLTDLTEQSKKSFLAKFHESFRDNFETYIQAQNGQKHIINCDDPNLCDRHAMDEEQCYKRLVAFCMTQRQYYQITNATEHLRDTFNTLQSKFLNMIDYLDETLTEQEDTVDRKKRSTLERMTHADLSEGELDHLGTLLDQMDRVNDILEGDPIEAPKFTHVQQEGLTIIPGKENLNIEQLVQGPVDHQKREKRKKRNLLVWLGLGWGVFSNARQIRQIKKNIQKLQQQNILQDKKIDELAKYMNLTMEKVREHDKRIYDLEVGLVQLRNTLVDLGFDFNYQVLTSHLLRNAQTAVQRLTTGMASAQYNVDKILEYLRSMATHQCSPVLISPPALRDLLQKVQERIRPNPRLMLPYDLDTEVWKFYDVLRITPVVMDRMLVILLTIPLTDQSLEMNIYKAHNLPLASPEYHVTSQYVLEGEYLAVDKDGMYVALPEKESIGLCLISDLGLCTIKQALYPTELVDWCIYAIFRQDATRIDKYCHYTFKNTDRNYAHSLGGFVWAVSAVAVEKLQIRCLTETHVVQIRPPVELIHVGNGCEAYSPNLFIPATSVLTSEVNIEERYSYFIEFNYRYTRDKAVGIWMKLEFKLQNRERAKTEVKVWPELVPMTYEHLNKKLDLIDDSDYPLELPTNVMLVVLIAATIITVVIIIIIGVKLWRDRSITSNLGKLSKMVNFEQGLGNLRNLLSLPSPPHFEIKEPENIPKSNKFGDIKPSAPVINVTPPGELSEIVVHSAPSTPDLTAREDTNELQYGGIKTTEIELQEVLREIVKDERRATKYNKYLAKQKAHRGST